MLERLIYTGKMIRTFFVSDKQYLKKRFIQQLGYTPNFEHPETFNEKVNARMIFERNPLHTKLADKLAVRSIVAEKIGESYLVPLIGIFNHFSEIDISKLPNQFVLKCSHDSGSAIVCLDKTIFNAQQSAIKINQHLLQNMYVRKREWHYKNIPPRILAEQYIPLFYDPDHCYTITTCRLHCFEGCPTFIEVDIQDQQKNNYTNLYNTQWILESFKVDRKEHTPFEIQQPKQFKQMLELSKQLCFKYGYSRIDFLLAQDKVYFSEITLTPNAGRMVIIPNEWDHKLGELWHSY